MNKPSSNELPIIECQEVIKEYIDGKMSVKVLTGVDLSLKRGEQVAIMGRSGSGKTTLLQMLGGLDIPTSGFVRMKGQNIHHLSEKERGKLRNESLGFVYQFHHLLPEFTALENVAMPLLIANVPPTEAKTRASEILGRVGLQNRLQHKPAELSGGERQRVAIARALVNNPDCLLADEPTGNLDEECANEVLQVLRDLNRERTITVIIVTHDPDLASAMDYTLMLQGGRLKPLMS